jgi:hypothetical protein
MMIRERAKQTQSAHFKMGMRAALEEYYRFNGMKPEAALARAERTIPMNQAA